VLVEEVARSVAAKPG
jgi:ABC-type nitrate/sulfonate/bicarbonate transport system substrate-binding protein